MFLDEQSVLDLLHTAVRRAGGQTAWSKKTGVNRSHLNKVLKGRKPLGGKIVRVLELEIAYKRKGPPPEKAGA
jgi:DNA-binding phage protein